MARVELPIEGMTCSHCVRTVVDALQKVPGVRSATVSLADKKAVVDVENGQVSRGDLAAAVALAGYRVRGAQPPSTVQISSGPPSPSALVKDIEPLAAPAASPKQRRPADANEPGVMLNIDGMTCASCVARVEKALAAVSGVSAARVNLATNQASVQFGDKPASLADLISAVERVGYEAAPAGTPADAGADLADRSERELFRWRWRLWVGAALLLPLVALHFWKPSGPAATWVQFVCATLLQVVVGWPYYVGALKRARYLSTNMDTLVTIGTLAAYGAGVFGLFASEHAAHGRPMYLMDAGMILVFITLGKYLEARAKGRASAAIRKLLDLAPPEAFVRRGGQLVGVTPAQVRVGEILVVRPGEKVPLDAEVTSGSSSVDESWLTGESLPVDKSPGSEILAGTINGQGSLTARVVRPAGKTALAQVIDLVRRAQESKTEIQRLADRVVAVFVPFVLLVAAITLLTWGLAATDWFGGLSAMVAVLVVACPCA